MNRPLFFSASFSVNVSVTAGLPVFLSPSEYFTFVTFVWMFQCVKSSSVCSFCTGIGKHGAWVCSLNGLKAAPQHPGRQQREILHQRHLGEHGINENGYVLYIKLLHQREQCSRVVLCCFSEGWVTLFSFFFFPQKRTAINKSERDVINMLEGVKGIFLPPTADESAIALSERKSALDLLSGFGKCLHFKKTFTLACSEWWIM